MKLYSYNIQTLTAFSNDVKSVMLSNLAEEGVITKEQAKEIERNWAVVLQDRPILGKLWNKVINKKDSNTISLEVVKRIKGPSSSG